MKKIVFPFFSLTMLSGLLLAQNDTMYIMNSGTVSGKYLTSEIDSIIFYNPAKAGLTVSDFDGNVYPTVTLGTQTWMAQNLRATHYADGTPVPRVSGTPNWDALTVSNQAYCWYDDDSTRNAGIYGALYTWAGAMKGAASSAATPSGIQGVCPSGWHLPSDDEWLILVSYLITNGYNYDGTSTGNKIGKTVASSSNWQASADSGTVGKPDYPAYRNKTGFSAPPGGYRDQWGTCFFLGAESHMWSATEYSDLAGLVHSLFYYSRDFITLPPSCYYKENGFSVRCVKD
jgi:uncharacterized protein (TIGR02145 family)